MMAKIIAPPAKWSAARLVIYIAYGCLALSLRAQSPEFDVASIKPNPSLPLMTIGPDFTPHGLHASKVTLRDLVMSAYDLTAPRVIGPGWLDGDRFDIIAQAPDGTSRADLRAMLQTLLKQRFHLVTHLETRKMPVYDLVVTKDGVKMPKYPALGPVGPAEPGKTYPGIKGIATMRASGQKIAFLADRLSGMTDRPIQDKTGLNDKYDFFLTWMPNLPTTGEEAEFGPPDLFTALQQQLGLKLQSSTALLDVVVVDQMDRMPTEN